MTIENFSRQLDHFFTRTDIASFCIKKTTEHLYHSSESWLWIEPSAGKGAFYNLLTSPKIGLDIMPLHPEIMVTDFLTWHPKNISQKVAVIGNPPFGKNSSLARKFFNHASSFADLIAFILPRTFEKPLFINRLDRRMHLVKSYPMPDFAFEFQDLPYDVPTVFQIWQKYSSLRPISKSITSHKDFTFVHANNADFAFQRVGARAGLVSVEGLTKSPQSHYFLKSRVSQHVLFDRLTNIDWSPMKHRTAGNPSIGKGELIEAYNLAYG